MDDQSSGVVDFIDGMRVEHDTFDQVIWKEVVEDDYYGVGRLRLGEGRVVDVGAHRGYFAYAVRRVDPDARVICVEPEPGNLEVLRFNARRVGGVAIVDQPVWYGAESVWLYGTTPPEGVPRRAGAARAFTDPSGDAGGRAAWAQERGVFAYRAEAPLRTVTVEEVLDHYDWQEYDVLKLDCEGAEHSILEGMDASRCRQVVGEFHDGARFRRMMSRLCARGGAFYGWDLLLRDDERSPSGELGFFLLTR